MTQTHFPAELETRIQYLENPANQDPGFLKIDWIWLTLLGLVAPVLLLIWGWFA